MSFCFAHLASWCATCVTSTCHARSRSADRLREIVMKKGGIPGLPAQRPSVEFLSALWPANHRGNSPLHGGTSLDLVTPAASWNCSSPTLPSSTDRDNHSNSPGRPTTGALSHARSPGQKGFSAPDQVVI